ncbi:hypothetical protein ACPPVO_17030 [Dactylosporangium sp. McL0621]|uniref:hypothetical protein n=1 Tax=Dactylosporangium sp. McL0621 TaxID=3415678 RepID=UPI003CEC16E1
MQLRSEMDLAETDLNAAGIGLRASGAELDVFEAELDLMVTKFRTVRAAEEPAPEPIAVEPEAEPEREPEPIAVEVEPEAEEEADEEEEEASVFVPWATISRSEAVEEPALLTVSDPEPEVEEKTTVTKAEPEPDVEDFGALVRVVRRYMQSTRRGALADPSDDGDDGDPDAEPPLSDVAVSPAPRFPAPKLTLAARNQKQARWRREQRQPRATRPRAHRRKRLSPPVSAALTLFVALVALGSGTVIALKMTGALPERQFQVGECVAQSAERATVVDCDARGAFEITEQIPKAERCPDVDQPFVIKDHAQYCLVPVPAGRR